MQGELLIFAERSVEVQSETIQPGEVPVRRNPAGHLIEAGWTRQRAGNAGSAEAHGGGTMLRAPLCSLWLRVSPPSRAKLFGYATASPHFFSCSSLR
jgi:hypothetical protein